MVALRGARTRSRRQFLRDVGLGVGALTLGPAIPQVGQAQAATIRVGVIAPLIFNFTIGVALQRGAQIARDEINDAGGILDRPVELSIQDNQLDPNVSQQRFRQLATQEGALAITGGFLDETTLPIVRNVLPRVRTPFLNSGTAASRTTELLREDFDTFRPYFRLMLSTEVLTQDTARAARALLGDQLGVQNVAIVAEDGGFGRTYQSFLEQELPNIGFTIPDGASVRFPQEGSFDFSGILNQIEQAGAEAFVVAFIRRDGFAFVRQWHDQGPRLPVIGINVSGQAFEYWQQSSGKVISHVYADAATGATDVTPKTQPFFNTYVDRFGDQSAPTRPLFTSYTTYDALFVLKQAIERIGEPPPDPSNAEAFASYQTELVGALEATDWTGTIGQIRFQGRDGERPHNPVTRDPETGEALVVPKWVQWQTDEQGNPDRNVVWPEIHKNADLIRPPQAG